MACKQLGRLTDFSWLRHSGRSAGGAATPIRNGRGSRTCAGFSGPPDETPHIGGDDR